MAIRFPSTETVARLHRMKTSPLRKMMPKSVGRRVALLVNVIVAIFGITFVIFDYQREVHRELTKTAMDLREQAMTLHQAISAVDRQSINEQQRVINAVCERMSDEESPGHHIVVENDGQILQAQPHHRDTVEQLTAMRSASAIDGKPEGGLLVGKHTEGGIAVYVGERMEKVQGAIRRQTLMRTIAIVLFGLTLAMAINLVIHQLLYKPLQHLVSMIDSIAVGNYSTSIEPHDGAELASLANAVNAMSDSLAQAESRRRIALDRARRVQVNLLPRDGDVKEIDVAFFHSTADEVGGDFVDVFRTNRGSIILCVADVVGHGIAPAMIAAMLKVLLLDAAEVHTRPEEILARLNERFMAVNLPEDFATIFLAVWTPKNRTLSYVNAGHEPALLFSPLAHPRILDATGPLVGIDATAVWETQSIYVRPNELFACWTDGITEAGVSNGIQYGREQLIALCLEGAATAPRVLADEVERVVRDHASRGSIADDCTFVAVRF